MTKPAPSFVYFVATPKRLLGSGAVPALADLLRAPMFQAIDNGPDGRAGVLVSESDCPSVRAVYRTDAGMRWEPWGDTPAGPAWVGMWDDWRPGPDPLARYRELCRRGEKLWAYLAKRDNAQRVTDAEATALLLDAMRLEYRLGNV